MPKSKALTTIEMFAGIGGFRLAAERRDLRTLWANDLDAKACAVYKNRFGDSEIREGDISLLKNTVPPHDVLTAGFPCQPFSSAGKKNGTRDPRGTLFQDIVDVLRRHQPQYFILENVKRLLVMERGMHFAAILSHLSALDYCIEWRLLNALHFGLPQNRQRVFLLGVRKDVLTAAGNEAAVSRLARSADFLPVPQKRLDQLYDMKRWGAISVHGATFGTWGIAQSGRFFSENVDLFSESADPVLLRSVLEKQVPPEFDFTETTLVRLKRSTPVHRFVAGVEVLSNQGGGARMGYTVFGINGVAPTLTATPSRHYERYQVGSRYRRLTNVEYARIQGFLDDHCRSASVYEQYSLFGNAVPPPMAEWVMKQMSKAGVAPEGREELQKGLFEYSL